VWDIYFLLRIGIIQVKVDITIPLCLCDCRPELIKGDVAITGIIANTMPNVFIIVWLQGERPPAEWAIVETWRGFYHKPEAAV